MIILSNSIPKTGSTHLANLQEDILNHSKVINGQETLRTNYKGRYIDGPSIKVLFDLFKINLLKGSMVVKCHWSFSRPLDLFCRLSNTKMTMTYRDPRDMILSMIDHGNRTRDGKYSSGAFSDCNNIIQLIPRTVKMMESFQIWQSRSYIHCIKYEELMSDKYNVLKEMIAFFQWDFKDNELKKIIESHEKSKKSSHNFNKGTTERWREEMNQNEKDACLKAFKPYLVGLDYSLI